MTALEAAARVAAWEAEDRRLSRPAGGPLPRLANADALRLGALYHVRLYDTAHTVADVRYCVDGSLYVEHADGSVSERLLCTSRVTMLREPPVCGCGRSYEWCERGCPWPVELEDVYWGRARPDREERARGR